MDDIRVIKVCMWPNNPRATIQAFFAELRLELEAEGHMKYSVDDPIFIALHVAEQAAKDAIPQPLTTT